MMLLDAGVPIAFGNDGPYGFCHPGRSVDELDAMQRVGMKPVEVLRTIHSFDPCMACAVHLLDTDEREITSIRIV